MTPIKKIIIIGLDGLGMLACNPDYDNILPVVETVDVSSPEDGVILVNGRVTDAHGLKIDATGFCASTNPLPTMEENQIIGSGTSDDFRGRLYYDQEGVTVYVRSFAVNQYGYSYGNSLPIITPSFSPPEVPCSLKTNTLVTNGVQYNLWYIDSSNVHQVFGDFALSAEAQSSGPGILIELNRKPRNGTYITVHGPDMGEAGNNAARVVINWSNPIEVEPDQEVYVTEQANGSFLFELCEVKYTVNGGDLDVSAAIKI